MEAKSLSPNAYTSSSSINIKAHLTDVQRRLDEGDKTANSHDKRITKLESANVKGGDDLAEMAKALNDRIDAEVCFKQYFMWLV